jgi:hypothetical protein
MDDGVTKQRGGGRRSRKNLPDDPAFAVDLREPLLHSLKIVGQLVMLQAQQMENRGVEVTYLNGMIDRFESKVIGLG